MLQQNLKSVMIKIKKNSFLDFIELVYLETVFGSAMNLKIKNPINV